MRSILLILILSFTTITHAAVRKNVADGESVTVQLSSKDPNVISVRDDRIERFSVVKGAVLGTLDSKHGVLTIKPSNSEAAEPFSMIVFTESGQRFTLLLLPMAIPSQDIILMPESSVAPKATAFEQKSPYTQVVTELMHHMVKQSLPPDYKRVFVNEEPTVFVPKADDFSVRRQESEAPGMHIECMTWVSERSQQHREFIWKGYMKGTLNKTSIYQGNYLSGEILEYTHHGVEGYKLMESDFYSQNVLAIALSQSIVYSGDVVTVFRVTRNG